MGDSLLRKHRARIDAIKPPDRYDCRNLLTGRTMHFIAESGIKFTADEVLQLTEEAMREQQEMDHRKDRESRRTSRYFRS